MSHNKKRYTKQQKQERVSRDQFAEFLEEHEWITDEVYDLGEDLLVRIYDDGRWAGITFFVQLKSTTNLDGHLIQGNQLSYPMKTKDLAHWQDVATPVYIVLWDINKRTGCWVSVDQAVKELDIRRPDWKQRNAVRIHIPRENVTTVQQLRRIRQLLAQHYLPALAQNRELTVHGKLAFTVDDEGRTALTQFQKHLATGEIVSISGKYIKALEFSDWWTRLFGRSDLSESVLTIGPARVERTVPLSFRVIQETSNEASLTYIELSERQSGTDEVTLSNEGQDCPITVKLIMRHSSKTLNFNYRLNTRRADVVLVDQAVQFIDALARGGSLELTNLQQSRSLRFEIPGSQISPLDPIFVETIHQLFMITRRTGVVLALEDRWLLEEDDIRTTREVYEIVTAGRFTSRGAVTIELVNYDHLKIEELTASREPQYLTMVSPESYADLLGVKIPLGPRTTTIHGLIHLQTPLESDLEEDVLRLRVESTELVDEYEKWLPIDLASQS